MNIGVPEKLLGGINTMAGKITCQPVADAHGLTYEDPSGLLA